MYPCYPKFSSRAIGAIGGGTSAKDAIILLMAVAMT